MKGLACIIMLLAVAATGCTKDKPVTTVTPNTGNSSDFHRILIFKYNGQSHDYCDCDQRHDSYFADSFEVSEFIGENKYELSGSGPLGSSKTFTKSTTNTYEFHEQNKSYMYRITGDSIYATFSLTHGMCVETYSFKGKKR